MVVFGGSNSVDNVSWSPDGTKLAFVNPYGEVFLAFYTVNADGTGLQHIGGDFENNNLPAWSPDSQRLAFATQRAGGGIDIVKADGTERVDLTNAPSSHHLPKWQPVALPNTPAGANVSVTTASGIQLTFSNVTGAGQTTVTPIDPNSLQGIPGEYIINANSLAFEITTTATYTGTIAIGFNVPGITNPITFSTLRVLHGEPPFPNFVDRTILRPRLARAQLPDAHRLRARQFVQPVRHRRERERRHGCAEHRSPHRLPMPSTCSGRVWRRLTPARMPVRASPRASARRLPARRSTRARSAPTASSSTRATTRATRARARRATASPTASSRSSTRRRPTRAAAPSPSSWS